MTRIRIPEVIPFVGRVCCWFSPLFPCVFSANNLVFPFPQKGALAIPNSKWYWEMDDEELLCEYATIIQSHLFIIFYCKTKCGYYDLRYSSDILGVMEIEIYRIIVLKLRIFYPELQDSLTCYAFSCPHLAFWLVSRFFLK